MALGLGDFASWGYSGESETLSILTPGRCCWHAEAMWFIHGCYSAPGTQLFLTSALLLIRNAKSTVSELPPPP
jgi:hypothetical protein